MHRLLILPCALLLAVPAINRADDAADMKALLEKAIKAHGGADNLTKYKAMVANAKGKFHGLGDPIEFTGEFSTQSPDKVRHEIGGKVMDFTFKRIEVVNGDKGWIVENDNKKDMTKDEMVEAREGMHAASVARLVTLSGKEYKLSPLGEAKVGDKETIGVRVERKDYRDISLYFDKKTGMLLKLETRVKDPMGGDKEYTQEVIYDDYKKVDGVEIAHKATIKRDNKPWVDSEIVECKLVEKLDDSVFAKP
jgi:outer membrane lipoprotein-sorting protein